MTRSTKVSRAAAIATMISAAAIAPVLTFSMAMAAEADSPPKTMPKISVQDQEEEVQKSEYRVGGDVQVITREEIENRHYTNITDAIKRIPGVQISSPGYRAYEYGTTFGEEISINGDSSVLISVDGRRIDNDASSFGGARSKSRVPLDLITNIHNVERIEVIKGTGAAAYGASAAGGIINIVTRTGRDHQETTLNAAAGSWDRQNYSATQSGPITSESFRYFVAGGYQTSGDTKYKDDDTGRTLTYLNTRSHDANASVRIDKDFTENQDLSFYYSWSDSVAHYPITAPDSNTLNLYYGSQLPSVSTAPGYRNWFLYDAWLGSYSQDRSSDVDLKYTFDKRDGLTSFARIYRNFRKYQTRDFAGLFGTQYANITQAAIDNAKTSAGTQRLETVDGVETQLAHKFGRHSLILGLEYRTSNFEQVNVSRQTSTAVDRDSYGGFLQDKIDITDRWTISPGILYGNFGTIDRTSATNVVTNKDSNNDLTFAFHSNYRFDLIGDLYFSWQQIFRPLSNADYDSQTTEILEPEKGEAWSIGIRKKFSAKTFASVNYSITDMSNAIGRYSVFDPTAVNTGSPTGFGNFVNRSVNATQKKKAFNVTATHQFDAHWAVSGSYAYVKDDFAAKNFAINPNDGANINALINKFRPINTYQADVLYTIGKWSATASAQIYTGNDLAYYTAEQFKVFGLVVNYDLFANTRLYLNLDNLTNETYENKATPTYGPGAFPQPGRNFMIGIQQRL